MAKKREKCQISKDIVSVIYNLDPPGRFLKKLSTFGRNIWHEVGYKVAREKVSQVLRDAGQNRRISKTVDVKKQKTPVEKTTTMECDLRCEQAATAKSCNEFSSNELRNTMRKKQPNISSTLCTESENKSSVLGSISMARQIVVSKYTVQDYKKTVDDSNEYHINEIQTYSYKDQKPTTPLPLNNAAVLTHRASEHHYFEEESPLVYGYHQYPFPTPHKENKSAIGPSEFSWATSPDIVKFRGRSPKGFDHNQNRYENFSNYSLSVKAASPSLSSVARKKAK